MRSTGFLHTGFLQAGFLGLAFSAVEAEEEEPVSPVDAAGRPGAWKLVFYDTTDAKVGEYSSDMGAHPVSGIQCELIETGCGAFSFTLSEFPAFTLDYNYRVKLFLFGESDPRYRGLIFKKPDSRSTKRLYKYSGHGGYAELETCGVNREYEDMEVSAVVRDILINDVQPYKTVTLSAEIIETNPAIKVAEIVFDRKSAKDCLKELAEYAYSEDAGGDANPYEVGVDETGGLFFRPVVQTVVKDAIKWIGPHVESVDPTEDINPVRNKIDILAGEIDEVDKTNYITTVEDAASQAAYGVRWEKETIPSALTEADAERWGNHKLYMVKDPRSKAPVKRVELFAEGNFTARGKMRITDAEGSELELFIKRVKYEISPDSGVQCNADLGQSERWPIDFKTVEMLRRIKDEEQLQAINVSQLA